jgi:NAD(P)H-hydrate epimerase
MENAGLAVAEIVMRATGAHDKKVLVLVGPGKNGGDGLITARHLSGWGVDVTAYLCSTRDEAETSGIKSIDARSDEDQHGLVSLLGGSDVVVDAIFGTGQNRRLKSWPWTFRQDWMPISERLTPSHHLPISP